MVKGKKNLYTHTGAFLRNELLSQIAFVSGYWFKCSQGADVKLGVKRI